jgi:GH24 family phage-related lysozyme (muramidase)
MFEDLKARLRKHEGVIPHLYLDTLGLVTCGVGHMIATEQGVANISMVRNGDSQPASLNDKVIEWRNVKSLEPARLPAYYEQHTTLRITDAVVDAIQDLDIATFTALLKGAFASWDVFPDAAKEALLDMAFQLGVAGLKSKFPVLTLAARAMKWYICAKQCHREGIAEWRNQATADLFLKAAAEPGF